MSDLGCMIVAAAERVLTVFPFADDYDELIGAAVLLISSLQNVPSDGSQPALAVHLCTVQVFIDRATSVRGVALEVIQDEVAEKIISGFQPSNNVTDWFKSYRYNAVDWSGGVC